MVVVHLGSSFSLSSYSSVAVAAAVAAVTTIAAAVADSYKPNHLQGFRTSVLRSFFITFKINVLFGNFIQYFGGYIDFFVYKCYKRIRGQILYFCP